MVFVYRWDSSLTCRAPVVWVLLKALESTELFVHPVHAPYRCLHQCDKLHMGSCLVSVVSQGLYHRTKLWSSLRPPSPFLSKPSFHVSSLWTYSSMEKAIMTMSSALRSSQGTPVNILHLSNEAVANLVNDFHSPLRQL